MKILLKLVLLVTIFPCYPQKMTEWQGKKYTEMKTDGRFTQKKGQNVRIMFYNAENLYDPYDDSTKLDDDYTYSGKMHWTHSRFHQKLDHFSKTILALGEWDPPAIIGLCEIENRYVLNKLLYESPLKPFRYRCIHHESPDARGIDVALLYRPDKFKLIRWASIHITFPMEPKAQTREILYVKGIIFQADTIDLFVNHWPSRRGGYNETQPKRNFVARRLRENVDSLLEQNPRAVIIIMGDLNDEPDNESITKVLQARTDTVKMNDHHLVNMMLDTFKKGNQGTIKYQGMWSVFDQFIVSGSLLKGSYGIVSSLHDVAIFNPSFLLEKDERYLGSRPRRTFSGMKYLGGFSDHLPIYMDIWKN